MIRPIKVKYRTRRKHARTKDWHHKDNLRYHPEFHIRKKALLEYFFSRPDELEPAITRSLQSGLPALVNVITKPAISALAAASILKNKESV